ncbi:hypothetical protein BCR43DRAFT_378701 [Syncephalastrum racemosum]|uniref:Uncharacterized protein n=1 Tax=Syncephalastrum racemosum TaxID=13706 RepID=A0A1X2H4Z8_SYNRA|nr:hypothetical protein BCR43DRAFT_378701 [Syncephalastrum racemosum]
MYSPPVVSVKEEERGIESSGTGAAAGAGGNHLLIPKGDSSALCRQSRPDRNAFRHSMASQYSSTSASGSSQSHRYSMASTSDNSSSDNIETRRWSAGSNLSSSAGGGIEHVTPRKSCSRFPGKEQRARVLRVRVLETFNGDVMIGSVLERDTHERKGEITNFFLFFSCAVYFLF